MSASSPLIMEEQYNFDLNFDFLDSSTSNVKQTSGISTNYPPTTDSQNYDVETLASKIASVNDLVLQLKTEQEKHGKLQKQMQDLSESAMSIRNLYEQEKTEKSKYAMLSQEFKEKYESTESQLTNKTLHFEQLSSKIEESAEKGPIPYNELLLRYHRLASCLDENKQLNHTEKQKLQQIQEYIEAKKLTALAPFKKKKKQPNNQERKDQETQYSPEMISKCTFTDFEVIPKKFVSQGTQHTWYTTTRGTNTEHQKEIKSQGTQYISSTTTRSTSTSGFIKTHSVGTNSPDESTKSVDDIFSEMIYDIIPLSPLAEEEIPPVKKIEMKTVGTITGLKNVRKSIDYVTPVSIKSSDSRPPSRNMFERVKNEIPFTSVPGMNSFVELGANSSSVPNNITELWNLLGHTFFSLLQNVNTLNSSMNLNVMNDRMRNANVNGNSTEEQPRNNSCSSNYAKDYFEDTCRSSNSPRGFHGTTRSTATSPIPELENITIQEQRFSKAVTNTINERIIDNVDPKPAPVEIQKIILNRIFHGETTASVPSHVDPPAKHDVQKGNLHSKETPKRFTEKLSKKSKSWGKVEANKGSETLQIPSAEIVTKSIQTCPEARQFDDSCVAEVGSGMAGNSSPHPVGSLESLSSEAVEEKSVYAALENELFGTSDDELSLTALSSEEIMLTNEPRIKDLEEKSEADIFCKPFMPKKRKHSIDTRVFHMEELKAAQQLQTRLNNGEDRMPKKRRSHSKRKGSPMKPSIQFNKIRIYSQPSLEMSNLFTGINSKQDLESTDVNKGFLSITYHTDGNKNLSTPTTPESFGGEMDKTNECPQSFTSAHREKSGGTLHEAESEMSTNLKVIFRDDNSLGQMRTPSTKEVGKVESTDVQKNSTLNCKPVIDASSAKPHALKITDNDKRSASQNELQDPRTNLLPQASKHEIFPLESDSVTLQNRRSCSFTETSAEISSKMATSKEESKTSNSACVLSLPEIEKFQIPSEQMKHLPEPGTQRLLIDSEFDERVQVTESKCATSIFISKQTTSLQNSIENVLLDENNETFQEIFHRICDEFATPERPVSAIPPCESSEAEDSFLEETKSVAPMKERVKRKRPFSSVTTVKRSERLKAKNSIQEAMKYSQLKIPAIELGKYTKRKMELNDEKTLPPARKSNDEDVSSSACRLGFFNDEESLVEDEPVSESSIQISTSGNEEDTFNELVIDLEHETSPTQGSGEVNSPPEENKSPHISTEDISAESLSLFSIDESCEPATSLNFDDSPKSPAPSDREPEADHIPLQVIEKTNKRPKTNSLLSQIIVNYNQEYHQMVLGSRKEYDKTIIKQLQATVTNFANVPDDSENIARVVEKICSIARCEQLIANGIISVVKTAPRPETECPPPVPELYLVNQLRKILLLLDPLYEQLPKLRTALLMNVEKSIFTFTKDFVSLNVTLNLTQFYLAVIANADSPSNPARLFICKCIFFYSKKAIPMIYETLCVYPSVLPHRDDQTYDRSDALISTIQCHLMSVYYDPEKVDLKSKQMFHKLRNFYNYESLKPSREEVIENLVAKLRAGRLKNVSYSFAIICKRMDQKNIEKAILDERLLPLANEYYHTISETAENDQRIACVLECISYIIKPFPVDTDITTYANLYSRFLNATDRQVVQEAAVSAILRTVRFGYVQCFRAIYNFKPKYEITDETKVMLRSFIYRKSSSYLRKLENQMQVLTQ